MELATRLGNAMAGLSSTQHVTLWRAALSMPVHGGLRKDAPSLLLLLGRAQSWQSGGAECTQLGQEVWAEVDGSPPHTGPQSPCHLGLGRRAQPLPNPVRARAHARAHARSHARARRMQTRCGQHLHGPPGSGSGEGGRMEKLEPPAAANLCALHRSDRSAQPHNQTRPRVCSSQAGCLAGLAVWG